MQSSLKANKLALLGSLPGLRSLIVFRPLVMRSLHPPSARDRRYRLEGFQDRADLVTLNLLSRFLFLGSYSPGNLYHSMVFCLPNSTPTV